MIDRFNLIAKLDGLVHNLKATKARSHFMLKENLNLNIYKYEPTDYLELVEQNEQQQHPAEYEKFKDFKEREHQRHQHEIWLAQERQKKTNKRCACHFNPAVKDAAKVAAMPAIYRGKCCGASASIRSTKAATDANGNPIITVTKSTKAATDAQGNPITTVTKTTKAATDAQGNPITTVSPHTPAHRAGLQICHACVCIYLSSIKLWKRVN